MIQLRRLGIAAQLIVPFIAISVLTIVLLGASYVVALNKALFDSLDSKSLIITQNLSSELSDPLSMGEYDRMQRMLVSMQTLDDCLFYAVVVSADGRVLASTDPTVKNVRLDRDDFEKSALAAEKYIRRDTKYSNLFEIVAPVMSASGEKCGVLRAGFSRSAAEETIRDSTVEILLIGAFALIVGIGTYIFVIRKSIIRPITKVAELAARISEGDLSRTVQTSRDDEIGKLLKAQAEMVHYLRDMAKIAESIAAGDLSVSVGVRSEVDVFSKALDGMVKSLNLQRNEISQLAAIVEYSEDAIYSVSKDGKIISWNKSAEKLFGYMAEAIVGNSVELLFLKDDRTAFLDLISKVFDNQPLELSETVNVKQDGSSVHVSLSVSPVKTDDIKTLAVSIIARDITDKKLVEERIREFYSIVSHELRTPLTSIRGALCLLDAGLVEAGSQEGSELIAIAKSSTERLGRLINDILDLRKIESGNLDLIITNVEASELLDNAVTAMQTMANDRGTHLLVDCCCNGKVVADIDRVTQVMTNLISNAIKFSETGGSIYVKAARSETLGMLRFSIKDEGQGISDEGQLKLFQKFEQVDSSDTRAKEGTGLGLAISKAIVEQHGGSIGVQSATGAGSTFWFELPLAAVADASSTKKTAPFMKRDRYSLVTNSLN